MCDCYKVGGPWIAEDPECPIHGYAAQAEERYQQSVRESLDERVRQLEIAVWEMEKRIKELE